MYGRETNDIYYTALLPVKKSDTVKAKFLLVIFAQMIQILITIPFAFLRVHLLTEGNPAGIEANIAFYGFGLITYAVFNYIFLTYFFKSAHKVGNALLLAIVPATLIVLIMEVIVHFPNFAWLDSIELNIMIKQIPILLIGIVIYIVLNFFAYKVSVKRFEHVDL